MGIITETCSRLIGGLVQYSIGVIVKAPRISNPNHIDDNDHQNHDDHHQIIASQRQQQSNIVDHGKSMQARALIAVFGMQEDGRIRKEKAREVVARLGLLRNDEEHSGVHSFFDSSGEEVAAAEVLAGGEEPLLRQAFKIFDENGNGFIEAVELKRVLECLGLDCGWDMDEIEKMLKVVDLNLDGKVDFGEFELMMMGINNYSN